MNRYRAVQGGQGAAGAGMGGQAAGGGPGILAGQMGYGGSVVLPPFPSVRNLSFGVLVLHLLRFLSLSHARARALSVHFSKEGGGKTPLKLRDLCSWACFPPSVFWRRAYERDLLDQKWAPSCTNSLHFWCLTSVSLWTGTFKQNTIDRREWTRLVPSAAGQ